ncbi:MAG: hypothetical protein OEV42_06615 [Deltaproteobacteria bacterium]|nr:hypothetical protein [Deltaproteobacteria bacterium]
MKFRLFIRKALCSCLPLLFIIVVSVNVSASQDDYIDTEELISVINTKNVDSVIEALNKVNKMRYQGEILPLIKDLWGGNKDKYPELSWETINKNIVKVKIAGVLLQAKRNKKIDVDTEEIRKYVTEYIVSDDVHLSINAMLALSIIDDERDVENIFSVAKQQKKVTFRTSISTLSLMCNKAASDALDELEKIVKSNELKLIIIETRKGSSEFKKNTHWCDRSR